MTRRYWIVVGVLLAGGSWAWCGEKPKAPSEREIKALVDQLVSPNPAPIIKDDSYREPKGFSRKKQAKVHAARAKLHELGPKAFPFLIERLNDRRYSLTVDDGPAPSNETIADVCRDIIADHIQPYGFWPKVRDDPRGYSRRPSYEGTFLRSRQVARKWWEKNKDKSLYRIQLEVLDWVIAEEAKCPRDFTDEEREYLRQVRTKLVKSGKALPAGIAYGRETLEAPPR